MSKTIQLKVMRGTGNELKLKEFSVEYFERMTVLDALIAVRNSVSPSLGFRHACRSGFTCKQCLVLIDGEPRYSCTTLLEEGMVIAPIKRQAHRDLVSK